MFSELLQFALAPPCRRATAVQVAFEVFPVDGSNIQARSQQSLDACAYSLECRTFNGVLKPGGAAKQRKCHPIAL